MLQEAVLDRAYLQNIAVLFFRLVQARDSSDLDKTGYLLKIQIRSPWCTLKNKEKKFQFGNGHIVFQLNVHLFFQNLLLDVRCP
jgi:hypothetical protein